MVQEDLPVTGKYLGEVMITDPEGNVVIYSLYNNDEGYVLWKQVGKSQKIARKQEKTLENNEQLVFFVANILVQLT